MIVYPSIDLIHDLIYHDNQMLIHSIVTFYFAISLVVPSHGQDPQFGPLMEPFLPFGQRLPGLPQVFPGVVPGNGKFLVFPSDSAAGFEESSNRCHFLNARLAMLDGPDDLEILGCLLKTPAYVGGWKHREISGDKGCMIVMPGGALIGIHLMQLICHQKPKTFVMSPEPRYVRFGNSPEYVFLGTCLYSSNLHLPRLVSHLSINCNLLYCP
jgi:hypothetical protein